MRKEKKRREEKREEMKRQEMGKTREEKKRKEEKGTKRGQKGDRLHKNEMKLGQASRDEMK